jgi:hypothetical protein
MIAAFEIARLFRRGVRLSWTRHTTPKHFSTFWQFLDAIVSEETPFRTLEIAHLLLSRFGGDCRPGLSSK